MSSPENRDLKLTLRTLLAWLDDQLPADDVRQIGQKVSESNVAQALIKKIQKVTRRRRLTVPNASGPDGTDPNLVASYLDNQLPAEKVAEYEEKCLRSDLDLAEVASCHQILSMISQRAKVPAEARFRMYRLVKGREAIARDVGRTTASVSAEPAAKPIPAWSPPGGVRRRNVIERFGPVAAALALMLVMGVSARMMIPPPEELALSRPTVTDDASAADGAPAVAGIGGDPAFGGGAQPAENEAPADLADLSLRPGETDAAALAEPDGGSEGAGGESSPLPGPGRVEDLADGLVLRWDQNERVWLPLEQGTALAADDRVIAPAPFQPILRLGSTSVRLVGPVEIQVLEPADNGSTRIALADGRLVLRSDNPAPATVVLESQEVRFALPAGSSIGVERVENWPAGAEAPAAPGLIVSAAESQLGLEANGIEETLTGPGSIVFRLPARWTDSTSGGAPTWVTDELLDDVDLLTGQEFAAYFGPGVSTTRALVEAVEDETAAVRQFAISTLGLLGAVDLVAAALTRSEDPSTRQSAILALREYGARSPLSARDLRQKLTQFNGEGWANLVFGLLAGTSAEQAGQRQTYADLVGLLEHPDLGIRTLALDQLMTLTGRDTLRYDPSQPTGPGLDTWKSLLRSGEIQPRGVLEDLPKEESPDPAPAAGQPPQR